MTKYINRLLWAAGVLLISLGLSSHLLATEHDGRSEKQAQLNSLNQEIEQLQHKLQRSQNKKDLLNAELQQTEVEIGKLLRNINSMAQQLTVKKQEVVQLQQKTLLQENNIERQQALLTQQLQTAYLLGQSSYIKLLLNQQDPRQLNRFLKYYGYINSARVGLITEYKDLVKELADTRREIETYQQTLQSLIQQTQQDHQQLLSRQDYRLIITKELNNQVAGSSEELQILLNNKNELELLIKRLYSPFAVVDGSKPFASLQKQLPWPTKGEVTVSYGEKNSHNSMKNNGIFIQAPVGENVQAVYPGQVVFANWLKGYGLLIILDHGDGYMTLYAHNQSLYRETGDIVSAGDIIATVGNSGGNPEDGLYFEIRHDGKPNNPFKWFT